MIGFLDNLDSLHFFVAQVVYKANLRGPSFRCEENPNGTLTLHYYSSRAALYPIVKGVLIEIAKRVFRMEISITVTGRTQNTIRTKGGQGFEEHVVFLIKPTTNAGKRFIDHHSSSTLGDQDGSILRVTPTDLPDLLPYHIIIDHDCRLVQAGAQLQKLISPTLLLPGTPIEEIFTLNRPHINLNFENICNFINGVFVLQLRPPDPEFPVVVPQCNILWLSPTTNAGKRFIDHHSSSTLGDQDGSILRVTPTDLPDLLPYHIIIDHDCRLVQAGAQLQKLISPTLLLPGTPIEEIFTLNRPHINLNFENICNFINGVFVLQLRPQADCSTLNSRRSIISSTISQQLTYSSVDLQMRTQLKLKGQMRLLESGKHFLYLCSPYISSAYELQKTNTVFEMIPLYDPTRDLILLNQLRFADMELNHQLESNNENLERIAEELTKEKQKTESLLYEMLPASVATQLLNGEHVKARKLYLHQRTLYSYLWPSLFKKYPELSNERSMSVSKRGIKYGNG
ncbi:Soluble guanylate cyclase gcy-36 [Toxocara canis]|uniref:guanylate cyclase n=1 Tax=Toxocara canis TaxID=6265 RepID=A0A0B2VV73_TOXCA|nr:Soluble guanylate cyclase gcy-36 [Toxocara canis]